MMWSLADYQQVRGPGDDVVPGGLSAGEGSDGRRVGPASCLLETAKHELQMTQIGIVFTNSFGKTRKY